MELNSAIKLHYVLLTHGPNYNLLIISYKGRVHGSLGVEVYFTPNPPPDGTVGAKEGL